MTGRINSFQSLGTVDGPGIRFVVFMQGCPLRCGCCHNPDTWDYSAGSEYTAEQVIKKALNFTDYFGTDGGITVSGGEPLLQAEFVRKLFRLCHDNGVNTCLDTSGCILNESVKKLLNITDRVLLDIKYTDGELYKKHVGCELASVIEFLEYLEKQKISTTVRQVIIPTLNDNKESVLKLKEITDKYACVDKVELLPFKKICQVKYDQLKIDFAFKDIPIPTKEKMQELNEYLK